MKQKPLRLLVLGPHGAGKGTQAVLLAKEFGIQPGDVDNATTEEILTLQTKKDVEMGINDNGFYLSSDKMNLEKAFNFLNEKNLEDILKEAIEKTDILTRRFRHCATRSLMILRSYKGKSKTVGKIL